MKKNIAFAIHGGAGTILRAEMTTEKELAYTEGLRIALERGYKVLQSKGSALAAVETAVNALEDCPLFNAGRGAVFTADGKNEMDAAIMDGKNLAAGSVANITGVKNPISLARLVMEKTEFVMLAGEGAMQFARDCEIELMPAEYFYTEFRYNQLLEARKENRVQLDHAGEGKSEESQNPKSKIQNPKIQNGNCRRGRV